LEKSSPPVSEDNGRKSELSFTLTKARLLRISGVFFLCLALCVGGWVQWGDWPQPVTAEILQDIDLIVVLGGGALERPGKAFELYQKNVSSHLLVTGDGNIIYDQLLKLGVPARDIIHETEAHSTWENAEFSGRTPEFHQARRIVLVTTWFHGPRALAIFEKQFPEKTFLIAAEPLKHPLNPWEKGFRRRERYATIYYWLFHGIWPDRQRHPLASNH
jgi:uncharacterized SAM-binding protein YcdF (DUF218 family)